MCQPATTPIHAQDTAPVQRGFVATCIHCGEEYVKVNLDDVSQFFCGNCEAEFTLDEVKAHIAQWERVVDWVESAPVYGSEEE